MRICVIGTSNAIYKDGYCKGLEEHPAVTRFEKFCIGASPSIIVPYFAARIDFSQFDWVVFETGINDRNYYKFKSIRKDQIRAFLEHGMAVAAEAGCRSALVLMPARKLFDTKTAISRVLYGKLAREYRLPLMDGYDFVARKLAEGAVPDLDAAFLDDFHILKPMARALGREMAERLARHDGPAPARVPTPSRSYRVVPLATGPETIRRSSSAAAASFARLEAGGLSIPAGPEEELAGLSFNAGLTTGGVTTGPGFVKSLRSRYAGQGREFLLLAAPVTTKGLRATEGRIRLDLAPQGATPTEPSRFDHIKPSQPDAPPYVEIEAAILSGPAKAAGRDGGTGWFARWFKTARVAMRG